ncbi:MAG TPA: 4Fe-4S binding protein [Anaerolineaceae bacterium]|nr:4Fe-4S binding protein [Anaerolineaceae bacterium]
MNIFNVLLHNFTLRPRTLPPEDRVAYPEGFRGELGHQAELCTLCGTCAYVCSPGAIHLEKGPEAGAWNYDTGRCTFCGRCAEYCPTHALALATRPVGLFEERAVQQIEHVVAYQHCTRCGATILPLPAETLVRLYHNPEAAQEAMKANRLCPKCRGYVESQRFKLGLGGQPD